MTFAVTLIYRANGITARYSKPVEKQSLPAWPFPTGSRPAVTA